MLSATAHISTSCAPKRNRFRSEFKSRIKAYILAARTVTNLFCGYLHNLKYDPDNELFSSRHAHLLAAYPLFYGDQTDSFAEYLNRSLGKGGGLSILETVLKSRYEVSKKPLDHTHEVIHGQNVYVLLDEQQVVFNSVLEVARKAREDYGKVGKAVVLIKGGPGTGKSVIALYLIAELSALGFNTQTRNRLQSLYRKYWETRRG